MKTIMFSQNLIATKRRKLNNFLQNEKKFSDMVRIIYRKIYFGYYLDYAKQVQ